MDQKITELQVLLVKERLQDECTLVKKMAGHLGASTVTIKKLKILKVDTKQNLLILKGSVPGKPGNLLSIRPTNCKD